MVRCSSCMVWHCGGGGARGVWLLAAEVDHGNEFLFTRTEELAGSPGGLDTVSNVVG